MTEKNGSNPLLQKFDTPFQTPPFDLIQVEDYKPAFQEAIRLARKEIDGIAGNTAEPDFENTIAALDRSGEMLDRISSIFFNLNSACTNGSIQKTAQEISPELTAFSNSVHMNTVLFQRVRTVYRNRDTYGLTPEEMTLLEDTWKSFVKGGADLEGEKKARFQEINMELSRLELQFEENVLAETNAFELLLTRPDEVAGLPEGALETAAMAAEEKGSKGWLFTLHAPSYIPFMKYADRRDLREKMFRAYASRGNGRNANDNNDVIRRMVNLRREKAEILGYATYADYVLNNRMAETTEKVNRFLDTLFKASHPYAVKEKEEMETFARSQGFDGTLQRWDWAYYANRLKQERYSLDDEMLKPYFRLENVCKGVFGLATRLYGISFRENHDIPKYHPDVRTYEVYDEDGKFLAVLYTDFFPRESKSGGAWMTEYRGQHRNAAGEDIRPVVSIVMNFTKPTPSKPSLLTFDEVTTFLHEFGHSLHGMFSRCSFNSTGGTNVYRDFVELPSQLMENWAFEKEWLDTWAEHYETGEKLPQEYIDRIRRSANFLSGYQSDRQLSFGMVDMAWHSLRREFTGDVHNFELQAMAPTETFPVVEGSCFSTAFGHIFSGGYAAGYYSYKWAEVLDADAFSLFKQTGIFNRTTASAFRKNVLEKGGSEHPMLLYTRFRGQEPTIDALLERSGLKG